LGTPGNPSGVGLDSLTPPQKYWQETTGSGNHWICPSARARPYTPEIHPDLPPPGPGTQSWGGGLGRNGTVDSAWVGGSVSVVQSSGVTTTNIDIKIGSYAENYWIGRPPSDYKPKPAWANWGYTSEAEIAPAMTPVVGDAVTRDSSPFETDLPATNLQTGGDSGLAAFAIPRHGSTPTPAPTDYPVNSALPGAINLSCFDGHSEQVKLDRLWQFLWHKDYIPPAKRPGL
jgi:hypothetical protein